MILRGELRRNHSAAMPWQYLGSLTLPAGRVMAIRGKVDEAAGHKFFALEFELQPGFSAAELENMLVEIESESAAKAHRDGLSVSDLQADELPF